MNVFEYKKMRVETTKLNFEIFKEQGKEAVRLGARLLSMKEGDQLVFDDEEDIGILNDFVNNEVICNDKRGFEIFFERNNDLTGIGKEYIEALKSSVTSFFRIVKTVPENKEIILDDMITDEQFTVFDINFSKSARPGVLLFVRIIPFKDAYVFSGMATFVYNSLNEETLLRYFRRELRKLKLLNPDTAKYIAAYNVFKRYGLKTIFS